MISVIFCQHRGDFIFHALNTCLESKDVEFEIIVVTSDPRIKEFETKYPTVRFIASEGGPALKRNIGFRYASGKNIAFFDDDVEIPPLCLYYMEREIKGDVGMVFGKTLNAEFRNHFDCAGSFLTSSGFLYAREQSGIEDRGQFDKTCEVLAGKSACCMISRRVFGLAGLYDSSYEILGEETDLAWRVWLVGYRCLFVPKAIAFHFFNTRWKTADFYTNQRVYFNGCRNYISMLTTNLETKSLWIVPLHILIWAVAGTGMFFGGKTSASKYIFKGIFHYLKHLPLQKRKQVQSKRVISDKDLFRVILRNPPISYYTKRLVHYIQTGRHG